MKRSCIMMLTFCVAGCSIPRQIIEVQRDSVRTVVQNRVVYRDSIIYVPVPTEADRAELADSDTSRLETSLAVSEAFVADGMLHHSLRNRSDALLPVPVKLPSLLHQEQHYLIRDRVATETVYVEKELSRWQHFLQTVGIAVLGAVAVWLVLKIRRFFV